MIHHYSSGKANKSYKHINIIGIHHHVWYYVLALPDESSTKKDHINYLQVTMGFRNPIPMDPRLVVAQRLLSPDPFFGSPPWHPMAHGCWALGPGQDAMAVVTKKGWDDRMGWNNFWTFFGGNLGFVCGIFFRMGIVWSTFWHQPLLVRGRL